MPRWKNTLHTSAEIQRAKRQAVLKEAGRAFSRRGYHNTSLDDVAAALNVSKGTLYNYVKDKHEILYELHKEAMEIAARAFEAAERGGGTGAERIRATLRHYIMGFTSELGACVVLAEEDALRDKERAEIIKQRDGFHRMFVEQFKLGIRDGSLKPVDPSLAVFAFMGAVIWLPRWYSPTGKLSGEELAGALTDILIGGLETGASAAKPVPRRRPKPS